MRIGFVECLRAGHDTGDTCPASLEVYEQKLRDLDHYITRLNTAREQVRAQQVAALARRSTTGSPRCQFDHATT